MTKDRRTRDQFQRDNELIRQIAERGAALYKQFGVDGVTAQLLMLKLRIVHEMIIPLRLDELLAANDGDFAHDVAGIRDNLIIGKATRLHAFMPRYAIDDRTLINACPK